MEELNRISVRSRRSRQQIHDLLSEFEKSGRSVTDFCKLHNISTGNFHKWKSRYRGTSSGSKRSSGFAMLDVINAPTVFSGLFAEVKGIRIYQPVSASFLKELLG